MFRYQYGGGCHKSPKGRCAKWAGADADNCALNQLSGRCSSEKGMARRMGPKREPTAAQLAGLAKGRATRMAKAAAKRSAQAGGGCHLSPKGRCAKWAGADADNCALNQLSGRCSSEKGMVRRMGPKREPTAAQLAGLAKGRATRMAKAAAKRGQAGGYGWF